MDGLVDLRGLWAIGLGMVFIFMRPAPLPEDARYMGANLQALQMVVPRLAVWLGKVFVVMGRFMAGLGALTVCFCWKVLPPVAWAIAVLLLSTEASSHQTVSSKPQCRNRSRHIGCLVHPLFNHGVILMKLSTTASLCMVFLLSASAALAQPANAPKMSGSAPMMSGGMAGMGRGSQEMHQRMMSGAKNMQDMPMSGDVDKDFAMMMRAHHQQAVEMAQIQVQNGKSPELKKMARKVIADQKREIAQFDTWLAGHK